MPPSNNLENERLAAHADRIVDMQGKMLRGHTFSWDRVEELDTPLFGLRKTQIEVIGPNRQGLGTYISVSYDRRTNPCRVNMSLEIPQAVVRLRSQIKYQAGVRTSALAYIAGWHANRPQVLSFGTTVAPQHWAPLDSFDGSFGSLLGAFLAECRIIRPTATNFPAAPYKEPQVEP